MAFQERGAIAFDYGNNLRAGAELGGLAHDRAYAYPGFVPAFVRPMFCEGKGPFRWAALSRRSRGHREDRPSGGRAVPARTSGCTGGSRWPQERVAFQGLPARICWLGYGERAKAGLKFNEMVASGELAAPIVIGRDHLDSGSVARPYRETEAMKDGSRRDRGLADPERPGQHRGRRALGERPSRRRRRASATRSTRGWSWSPTGATTRAERLERVLTSDPGMGVIRHADAGYDRAREVAHERGVRIPMEER